MIYFVSKSFTANTANANRMLAFANGLSEHKTTCKFVFFTPDSKFSKCPGPLQFVTFCYLWDACYYPKGILKILCSIINVLRFVLYLRPNDKVIFLGAVDIMHFVRKIPYIKVYAEETECPEIVLVNNSIGSIRLDKYLKDIKRLNGLFVISNSLKKYFAEKGVDASKIEVINMIVDEKRFNGLTKCKSEKYLAYCGTITYYKDGVDTLFKSFSIVNRKFPNIKLYIIGPFLDNKTEEQCYDLIRTLGLSDVVSFLGQVDSEELPGILLNAEMLLLSRPDNVQAKYGFPTKLGEYLLTANPVIVTNVGDIGLFLQDKKSAYLAKPDDAEDFASKIIYVLDNPSEGIDVGINGQRVALSQFNYCCETKKMIDFINTH